MFFMDAHSELSPLDSTYLKALRAYVWSAYELDSGDGDVSTKAFLGTGKKVIKAKVVVHEAGILAGIQEADWLLKHLNIRILKKKKDGAKLKKGTEVMEIKGKAATVLGVERTLLNLLQRMSGIATKTARMKARAPKGVKLLATRKTLWGPLDKRAASLGGAGTHRLNLGDAILVKENHIQLSPDFKRSLKRAIERSKKVRFVEIELESPKEVTLFLEHYKKLKKLLPKGDALVVMLDNFRPAQIKQVIKPLKEAGLFVEVSGGVRERNIIRYGIAGVDAISSGNLTTDAPNLDLSLQVEKI